VDVPHDWWRSFFSGVVLDMWRRALSPEQTRAEADFIQQALRVAPPARLLDVPCGNGRIAVELAARDYVLTGVDLAEGFIDEARKQSAERGLSATWHQGDMRNLPWPAAFDGAYCWGNSFGYLDDEGNAAFLKAAAGALKPGGRFALEYGAALECLLSNYQERRWYEFGDILFLVANQYDPMRGRLETEYTFIRGGKADKRLGFQRAYSCSEVCGLLRAAGFTDVEAFGSIGGEPFKVGSQRLILTATRAG
jgi:SAM-dependent methyltransferase